jgi:uncharacterized membrane protein YvbJ
VITCQACGTQNPPDAVYCTKCARKLDTATQQAVVQQRAGYMATGISITRVVASAVVAIVIIVLVVFFVIHGM